jgi:hypothetical protein
MWVKIEAVGNLVTIVTVITSITNKTEPGARVATGNADGWQIAGGLSL